MERYQSRIEFELFKEQYINETVIWESQDKMFQVLHSQNTLFHNRYSQKDIQRVKKFFSRDNVYKQLKTMVSFLIPHRSDVKLILNVGGGSFTDGKSITVGLPDLFIGRSYGEIFTALRALVGHESQHVNSSDFPAFKKYIEDVTNYFAKKYPALSSNIARKYLEKVAHHFGNSVEDGRIEKITPQKFLGYAKYYKFLNMSIWEAQPIQGNSELEDFLYSVTSFSVTGLNPKDFKKFYKDTEVEENLNKIKPMILTGIEARTCVDCLNQTFDIIKAVEPYLVKLLSDRTKETEDFLNNMDDSHEFTTSEETEHNNDPSSVSTHFKPKKSKKDEEKKDEEQQEQQSGEGEDSKQKQKQKKKDQKDDSDDEQDKQSSGGSDSDSDEEKEQESDDENADGNGSSKDKEENEENEEGNGGSSDDESSDENNTDESDENSKGKGNEESDEEENESEETDGDGNEEDSEEESDDEGENGDTSDKESDNESDENEEGDQDGEKDGDDSDNDSEQSSDDDSADGENSDNNSSSDNDSDSSKQEDDDEEKQADHNPSGMEDKDADEVDESEVASFIEQLTKEVEEEANEKIQQKKEDIKKQKLKEEDFKLNEEELKELESHYRNDVNKHFQEVGDLQLRYHLPTDIKRDGSRFRKEVERIFRNKEEYTLRGQRKGILDVGKLHQLQTRDFNVFVKKGVPIKSDYVAFLLEDGSGSMSERGKWNESKRALSVMEEGLKGIIPFKIATFNTDWSGNSVVHQVVKDFKEENKSYNYSHNAFIQRRPSGGNKDGYSIRVATKELLKRPEKDRILIILSDGLPSNYRGGKDAGMVDVKEAIKEARKAGIFVVALLFGTEEFRDMNIESYRYMYEKNIISCESNMISNQLTRMLKKIIAH